MITNNVKRWLAASLATLAALTMSAEDVDTYLAVNDAANESTFVVIISNEHYKHEVEVPFALNDGETFRLYCEKTLGIPPQNIRFAPDASLNDMNYQLMWLEKIMAAHAGEARAIVYYSGHGMPDDSDKRAYMLPVDGYATFPGSGLATDALYKRLAQMPSQATLVLLDACFSGAKREGGMITNARGVAIKPKEAAVEGNLVVFSAAKGDETAMPLREQRHGLFTYHLLCALQQSGGAIALGDLCDQVTQQVNKDSWRINEKGQTPVVSAATANTAWRSWKLTPKAATRYVTIPRTLNTPQAPAGNDRQKAAPVVEDMGSTAPSMDVSKGGAFSLVGGVVYDLVRIEKATFTMGSRLNPDSYSTFSLDRPLHQVSLDAYLIGKTEVSQELWEAVMGSNPSAHKGAKLPVENVSWDDCQEFLRRLNEQLGTRFRLPTEAEWEYAADAEDDSQADTYAGTTRPDAVAVSGQATAPCASKRPSAIGLYDMSGNVAEWCHDYLARYPQARQSNPTGPAKGLQRVVRGGSYADPLIRLRNSHRSHMRPAETSPAVGFRLAHDAR